MGFWPFGKSKDEKDEEEVDFASRVVASSPNDGTTVRGKLTVHLEDPTTPERAEAVVAACAKIAESLIQAATSHEDLLGQEAELAAEIIARAGERDPKIRSVDLVALHVVGDLLPASTATPKPPSVSPGSHASADVGGALPPRVVAEPSVPVRSPSSAPPPRKLDSQAPPSFAPPSAPPASLPPRAINPGRGLDSSPPPRSQLPSSSGAPSSRRQSSGQLLAVRGERLIPDGATPEASGKALIPLMRDAATKLLIAVLRAYDLFVVRRISVDESPDALAAIVPTSTAPLGLFADSRAEELDRWEGALGLLKLEALRAETAAVTCFLLHQSLDHSGVPVASSTTILETIGEGAFDPGSSPLAQIGRYLHLSQGSPATELGTAIVKIVGHQDELARIEIALTPVLASLQEDLSFAATQARASLDSRH